MSDSPPQPPPSHPPHAAGAADPAAPPYAPGPYRDEVVGPDPRRTAWSIESLRTTLMLVGLLALVAIGLAVWALVRSEHRTAAAQAPATALVTLTTRLDRLDATVRSLNAGGGVLHAGTARSLGARIDALQQSEKQLATQVGKFGSAGQVSQLASKEAALSAKVSQWVGKEAGLSGQVSALQGRVAQMAGQIAQLSSQSGTLTTASGTTTTP